MNTALRNHIEEIVDMSDQEFEYISSHFHYKKLKKKQFLIEAGQQKVNKYFVLSGILKSYYIDKSDREHILQFAEPDWWITDYSAFFNNQESTIYIDCITDCELLYISNEDLEKLSAEFHKMEHFFRVKSNAGYVASQKRILAMLNLTSIERFNHFISLYPSLFQSLPKYLIASYIGISREMLSRLSKKLINHTK
ncbi:Crp/Fnr family transcriptional regulator [Elizabethkingia meningoseptica]|uniref:Crp/Fnr family transcriptional regulator n=1 Tax=Elizabethkingia meningoseptica TaxID=238 RepID=UPI0022F168A1|nr:Crp/Fnr family transcriptional regulator [Elizabethkingia meningoseptica]EJK5328159.1 Crp/Fnr family transcriptional regulator [Elizabethkingia meningoseptica]MCT3897476.1 Crp/Fnr family transcriptional regulator [Elizabethkingia anophelis]MCT4122345.1 Crp/Fnr family transcriptional regulator [Elizabethkingia anophelis]WBS74078.1 Crp/Fnr family transcriptional regulator [Elizabethkingia meningoseptica]